VTFKVTQGHWYWCYSIGHMWFPINLPLQLYLYRTVFEISIVISQNVWGHVTLSALHTAEFSCICAVAQYAVLEAIQANAIVNGRGQFLHPHPSETPQPISMSSNIWLCLPQRVDVQNLVGIDLAVTEMQVDTAHAMPISDLWTSICLTVVLVYYKDCWRISKKATESVKTIRITVDFYILYLCN